jgi:integrase
MPLTELAVRRAKAREKPYKLADSGGLYLLVQPNGAKHWRLKYRFVGKEKLLSFGPYPATSIAAARCRRDDAKTLIKNGTDPSLDRKIEKIAAVASASSTFGAVAEDYLAKMEAEGASASTIAKMRWLLEGLAAPLSKRPIAEIIPLEILTLLKMIEKSGRRETARRLRGAMGSVFRFAIVTLRATTDPTSALRDALLKPKVQHRAAITDERQLGALLKSIDEYDGWPTLRAALQFLALTMTRPGDVRHMRRKEVDFENAIWRIPAERMKMRRPHEVPLSKQSMRVLRETWSFSEYGELVFPSIRSVKKPLSENAMNAALRRMGYAKDEMTAHGFRSAASTILNERGFNSDVIEAALAHQDDDDVRRAYNRAKYLPQRAKLMQRWADMLDEFKRRPVRSRHAA